MRTTEEIARSIDNIGAISANIENMLELNRPLMKDLLPHAYRLTKLGIPLDGRIARLKKSYYKKQYDAGIERCVGINIKWED